MSGKIYTRKGDGGRTGLIGRVDVTKDDPRIEAYGTVDELSAALGCASAHSQDREILEWMERIQSDLFEVAALLAHAPKEGVDPPSWPGAGGKILALEKAMDGWSAELPPLKNFILPGGTLTSATLHLARTVCRRAERECVRLATLQPNSPDVVKYLNRLGDFLFVIARLANRREGRDDRIVRGK